MRGKKGSELQARHAFSPAEFSACCAGRGYVLADAKAIAEAPARRNAAMCGRRGEETTSEVIASVNAI
jgi:hypothetical protein